MDFIKAHGTGNDFVVVLDLADELEVSSALVQAVCDRHLGIGADGLIRIAPGSDAPYFMDYRNADGSIVEMCGNGVRVVGKVLADRGLVGGEHLDLETRAGVKQLLLHRGSDARVHSVTVDMGLPQLEKAALGMTGEGPAGEQVVQAGGRSWSATCVSMGNPHAVVFVDDVDAAPVERVGSEIETSALFSNGINVEFVELLGPDRLRQRTWERGVGETLACGTGACAVAVAAHLRGKIGRQCTIELRGGTLEIEWTASGALRMTGPAREVATGRLTSEFLEAAAARFAS